MKNKLVDLQNHLMASLERLGDENLKGSDLLSEIDRAEAIADTAKVVIANGALVLEAEKLKLKHMSEMESDKPPALPEILSGSRDDRPV